MRIVSGETQRYIYFVAVDSTDFTTRETGLSSFTVYRSRDGGAAAAMTTPTINETDVTNMPGVYELLLDEDTTLAAGNDSEEIAFHITHSGMAPVTRTIELYRPKITAGETATVASGVVESNAVQFSGDSTAANNAELAFDGTGYGFTGCTMPTVTTLTGHTAQTGDTYALANGATGFTAIDTVVDSILVDTAEIGAAGAGLTALATQASVDTVDSNVDAILVDTAEIGAAGAGLTGIPWNASWDTEVESECTDALNAYDPPTKAEMDTAHSTTDALITTVDTVVDNILVDTAEIGTAGAGLTDLGGASTALKAEILVEVNAALDTAISELGVGQPTATPTVRTGLMLLYMALRNKLDVSTSGTDQLEIHNDAGTIITKKVLTDDGSDYSEAKAVSG